MVRVYDDAAERSRHPDQVYEPKDSHIHAMQSEVDQTGEP